MNIGAAAANVLWRASGRAATRRFRTALHNPAEAQQRWLFAQLDRHAGSVYGLAHDFVRIRSVDEFRQHVPLVAPAQLAPWIERVRRGESRVLSCEAVTHLAPTSGSTGARKLVPFSHGLQRGFDAAVGPWMADLVGQRPRLLWGPAYWCITPLTNDGPGDIADDAANDGTARPRIGFADDADYLGGAAAWLVRRALAAPSSLRHERDIATFWRRTLWAVLGQRDLRLISIWHPSFLDLLVHAARADWSAVLDGLSTSRALELRAIGPEDWPRWWPHLQVVSCWGDQAAASGYRTLKARLPHLLVQPKGLLATEAVVTIPYAATHVLAVTSHYFEFLEASGEVRAAHEVERGAHYEVVVTNGGGLWRYRLGDVVECTGHVAATPTFRFLGRAGQHSDLRGEKLSEPFVAEVLRALWPVTPPSYVALRANDGGADAGYDLLLSSDDLRLAPADLIHRLDVALRANPHYATARRLGQLRGPQIVPVDRDHAMAELATQPGRLGGRKPRVLLRPEASA